MSNSCRLRVGIVPHALTMEIVFGATRSASAKGGVKLWVVTIDGSGEHKQAGTNKITLTFEARTG